MNFVSQDSWETKFTVSREISHWWFVIIIAFFVVEKKRHCLKNVPSTRAKHQSHHNHVTFCHGLITCTSRQQCTVTLCCQKMLPAYGSLVGNSLFVRCHVTMNQPIKSTAGIDWCRGIQEAHTGFLLTSNCLFENYNVWGILKIIDASDHM